MQITGIRHFAKMAVLVIWLAGIVSVLVFVLYFEFFASNITPFNSFANETVKQSNRENEEAALEDNTTLVNFGIKFQERGGGAYRPLNGSISIHKLHYDQQLKKVMRTAPVDFTVRKVPK